jgi:hypothetical protein
LALDVRDGALVIFRSCEFQVLRGLGYVFGERLGARDLLVRDGAPPEQPLGFLLIFPETRFTRELIELVYLASESRDVKETPLAHRRAA